MTIKKSQESFKGEGETGIGFRKPFNIHHLGGEDDRLRIHSKMSLGLRLTSDYSINNLVSLGVYLWGISQGGMDSFYWLSFLNQHCRDQYSACEQPEGNEKVSRIPPQGNFIKSILKL